MINKLYEKIKAFFKANYKFLIFMVILIFTFYYEFPYIIYKSGGTIDLTSRIEIDKEYTESGSLNMSYVTAMKGTIPFILMSYIMPDWDLYHISEITNEESYEDVLEVGKVYLNEGIDNAIIAAFKESDYGITFSNVKNEVLYLSEEAKTNLSIGDNIVSIDDLEVNSLEDVKKYVNTLKAGDEVSIKVVNNDTEEIKKAIIYEDSDKSLKIGVSFHTTYDYKTEIPVKVKMKKNESGSSGGLMMSLAIYNVLTKDDITHGKKIVGTGSITADGIVEEIGGVKYKVLGASKNKADLFLCPVENYEEAMKVKKEHKLDIEIVKVSTLHEAITYLNSLS